MVLPFKKTRFCSPGCAFGYHGGMALEPRKCPFRHSSKSPVAGSGPGSVGKVAGGFWPAGDLAADAWRSPRRPGGLGAAAKRSESDAVDAGGGQHVTNCRIL